MASDGKPLSTLGHFGHGDAELDHPSDVAVDPSGNVYIADTDNQRIAVFDKNGAFVRNFGGAGPYPGLFHTPTGIRYFDGRLYVADSGNHRIQVFDLNGEVQYEWGVHALVPREGHGKLHYPNQVAIAPSGKFAVVVEAFEDRIQIFGPETEESRVLQQSQEKSMASHFGAAIATAGPTLAILEPSTPSLLLWDVAGEEPVEITRFGRYGTKAGTFIRPEGIALDAEARRAYVVDPGQMTISVLDVARPKEDGLRYLPELVRFVKALDLRAIDDPTHPTWPIEPTAIKLGPKKDLWVLDAANRRVVVFDSGLGFVRAIGASMNVGASGTGGSSGATANVESGSTGTSASASGVSAGTSSLSSGTSRVSAGASGVSTGTSAESSSSSAASPAGTAGSSAAASSPVSIDDDADPSLLEPTDLAVSASGDLLYVVDSARARVQVFEANGKPVRTLGRRGSGPTDFVRPFGVAVAPGGDVYVTDEGGDKVVRFDPSGTAKQAFGKRGLGRVEFFKPKGLAFDAKGDLIVVDWGNHRGQVLTPDGEFLRAFGSRVFVVPTLKKP